MAPKKGKKKKDDDWEDEAEAIALESTLEILPDSKASAGADDDDDDAGGGKMSKKVSASRVAAARARVSATCKVRSFLIFKEQ